MAKKICDRCGGLTVHEKYYYETDVPWEGERCVACGDITDPVIILNRSGGKRPREKKSYRRIRFPLTEWGK